jgi:choice-of-anchor B domain-containing protein
MKTLIIIVTVFVCSISGTPGEAQVLDLLGQAPVSGRIFDVWGYYDTNTGKEYALVGSDEGLFIFDVSNPATPVQVAHPPGVPGFDIKIFQKYAYCVTGSGGMNQGKILDLTNPAAPVVAASFNSAHNIFIKDGYMYLEYPGLRIMNLNSNPLSPVQIYEDNDGDGHDAAVIGDRLFDFHGYSDTKIFNIQNPVAPVLLGTIDAPTIVYNHSGWTTTDGNFLFICDELSTNPTPDITVWNISNLGNMVQVGQFGEPNATVHNLYVRGSYAYVSYYEKGFRIFDISNPAQMDIVAEYDAVPGSMEGFGGAFGVYIYAPSGNIYVSDDDAGLLIFDFDSATIGITPVSSNIPGEFLLKQNYPNPFNPSTKIAFDIPKLNGVSLSHTTLKIFDIAGHETASLLEEDLLPGSYEIEWNAEAHPSGVYFYNLQAGGYTMTKKMILTK